MIISWRSDAVKAAAGAPRFSKLSSILSFDGLWNQRQRFRCPEMVRQKSLESDLMRILKATRAEVSGESLWNIAPATGVYAFRVAVDERMMLA